MDKITLASALSTVFGTPITTAAQVYAKDGSGNNGLITAANLASTLGGLIPRGDIPTNVNWDAASLRSGIYLVENKSWISGLPDNQVTGVLAILRPNDYGQYFKVALFFSDEENNDSRKVYYNIYRNAWAGWHRLDSFGYPTLSDLASALGVGITTSVTDLNNVTAFVCSVPTTALNRPSTMATNLNAYAITFSQLGTGNMIQFAADWYQRKFYVRTKMVGTWQNWREISQTELTT